MTHYLIGSLTSKWFAKILPEMQRQAGGIMIGLGPFKSRWFSEGKRLEDYPWFLEFDYSAFDQSLAPLMISTAFDIAATYYEDCPGKTEYFDYLKRNMIYTLILDPSGTAFRKRGGIASGDPWTSIIGSICNLLATTVGLNLLGYKLGVDYDPWVYGDDGLLGFRRKPPPIEELAKALKTHLGMTIKPAATKVSQELTTEILPNGNFKDGGNCTFLQNNWDEYLSPIRPMEDFLTHLYTPEKNPWFDRDARIPPVEYATWALSRVWAYYILWYYNPVVRDFIKRFWVYLRETLSYTYNPKYKHIAIDNLIEQRLNDQFLFSSRYFLMELPSDSVVSSLYLQQKPRRTEGL